MQFLKKGSLKKQLLMINLISLAGVLLLINISMLLFQLYDFKKDMINVLTTQGRIIGHNSTGALLFKDRYRATETLASLKFSQNIDYAVLYSEDRTVFAEFQPRKMKPYSAPPYPDRTGSFFSLHNLCLFQPVISENETIGMLYIQSDLSPVYQHVLNYLLTSLIYSALAFPFALLFLLRLQKAITEPIFRLLNIMQRISNMKDYTLRADTSGGDELARLAEGFNDMIVQVQKRDSALEQHQSNLEKLVDERTGKLIAANLRLQEELCVRKETEVALQQAKDEAVLANTSKSAFLANMSHEIRTPLNAVIGLSAFVLETDLAVQQRSCLETIRSSANSLLFLLNDILDISKIEAGKLELETIDFNLRQVLDITVRSLSFQAENKGLYLRTQVEADTPERLKGDPARLRQILVNLIGNALKFTRQGGIALTVSFQKDRPGEGRVLIAFSVADSGIGISSEKLRTIFDSFTQADSSISRHYGGTGLGLSIVRELTQKMGGDIRVESIVGSGSIFTVQLPFMEGNALDPGILSDKDTAVPSPLSRSLRVLLVEDTEQNRMVATLFLKKRGHTTVVANNGIEALALLERDDFDIVLMDVQMPEMDGFETTRIIRDPMSAMRRHDIPIVAMTAHAMREDMERCIDAGMDAFISKPMDMNEFYSTIEGFFTEGKQGYDEKKPSDQVGPNAREKAISKKNLYLNCGKNEDVIKEVMSAFLLNVTPERIAQITNALEKGDVLLVGRLAHSLKGAAGTIAALGLQQTASRIERAAGEMNTAVLEELCVRLQEDYAKVVSFIRNDENLP
jgi:signal transduction histidine kinase/DNA-binding response OmpR family regulator